MRQALVAALIMLVHAAGDCQTVFAVRCPADVRPGAARGRLLVALAPAASPAPVTMIGSAEAGAPRVFGRDADNAAPGATMFVSTDDEYSPHDPLPCTAATGPVPALPPGDWYGQAR